MNIERQMAALIELVENDRAAQIAAIAAEAASKATQTVSQARRSARERTRAALADERRRRAQLLAAATARLANEERQHQQQSHAALLALAWQALPAKLEARWASPSARADWLRHVFEAARTALAPGLWTVVHGRDLAGADRELLLGLGHAAGVTLEFAEDPMIRSGIKLRAGGNVVDGSTAGLLADRAALGSRLLDLLQENP